MRNRSEPKTALAVALVGVMLGASTGCGPLDPFEADTLPALESFEVRISAGVGAADAYLDEVEVGPRSTVQFNALIGDGNVIVVTMPREPADEIVAEARLEGSDEVLGSAVLRSRTGRPISVEDLYSFDPGYPGIEAHDSPEELELRIATPRLTDTGQGQVPFTFKSDVVAPDVAG